MWCLRQDFVKCKAFFHCFLGWVPCSHSIHTSFNKSRVLRWYRYVYQVNIFNIVFLVPKFQSFYSSRIEEAPYINEQVLRPRPLTCFWFMPPVYSQVKVLIKFIKLHNPGKFSEDRICSSYFRDRPPKVSVMPEAIFFDLFWVVFHGFLIQMRSNLYEIFISDSIWGNASHMLWFLVQSEIKPKNRFSGSL